MKIRYGFVSNSSSSSFSIPLESLTAKQLKKIEGHELVAGDNKWMIRTVGDVLLGYTHQDNFDMYEFMQSIGVKMSDVKWE